MKNLLVNNQKCVACFICTLACSFHHTKTFLPQESSLKIFDRGEKIEAKVLPTCDLCSSEKKPLCIEFCPVEAITLKGIW